MVSNVHHMKIITHTKYPVTTIDVDRYNKLIQIIWTFLYPVTGVVCDLFFVFLAECAFFSVKVVGPLCI